MSWASGLPRHVILSERVSASRRISHMAAARHEIPRFRRYAPPLGMTKAPHIINSRLGPVRNLIRNIGDPPLNVRVFEHFPAVNADLSAVLPQDADPNASYDPYELDRKYFELLWYKPKPTQH